MARERQVAIAGYRQTAHPRNRAAERDRIPVEIKDAAIRADGTEQERNVEVAACGPLDTAAVENNAAAENVRAEIDQAAGDRRLAAEVVVAGQREDAGAFLDQVA